MEAEFEGTSPRFTQKLQNLQSSPKDTVRFECRVTGSPEPTITWFREDEPLAGGGRHQFETSADLHVLTISHASVDDAGEYKCVARNSAGKVHCFAELTITGKAGRGLGALREAYTKRDHGAFSSLTIRAYTREDSMYQLVHNMRLTPSKT